MRDQHGLPSPSGAWDAVRSIGILILVGIWVVNLRAADDPTTLRERLKAIPFQIAYECYINANWEIFVVNADGSNPVNLTGTPRVHEHYPQVSPDRSKMCFSVDEGENRETVRSLYVMDIDGRNRKKIADYAREPFWSPDSKQIGYLPQEYPKFHVIDYYTRGMSFYDLATGTIEAHPNSTNLHHLYNPSFSPNSQWIVISGFRVIQIFPQTPALQLKDAGQLGVQGQFHDRT